MRFLFITLLLICSLGAYKTALGFEKEAILPNHCSQPVHIPNFIWEPQVRICLAQPEIIPNKYYITIENQRLEVIHVIPVNRRNIKVAKKKKAYRAKGKGRQKTNTSSQSLSRNYKAQYTGTLILIDRSGSHRHFETQINLVVDDTGNGLDARLTLTHNQNKQSISLQMMPVNEYPNACSEVYDKLAALKCFRYWAIKGDKVYLDYDEQINSSRSSQSSQAFNAIETLINAAKPTAFDNNLVNTKHTQIIKNTGYLVVFDANVDEPEYRYYFVPSGENVTPQHILTLPLTDVTYFYDKKLIDECKTKLFSLFIEEFEQYYLEYCDEY